MKYNNILMVQPAPDNYYSNVMLSPNLGLISLYSTLPSEIKKNTTMLDGNLTNNQSILEYIKVNNPDLVAISANSFNYNNAKLIAEHSKVSVIGGPHAGYLFKHKFENLPFDYVVSGNGNSVFKKIIFGEHKAKFYRENNFQNTSSLDYSILFNHPSTNPSEYMKSFPNKGLFKGVNLTLPIFSQYKCDNVGKKACKFCNVGRSSNKVDYDVFKKSYENLINQNPDLIWLVDGDISSDLIHLEELRKIYNDLGKVNQYAFARVDNVLNEGIPEALKKANIKSLFIGYEHGDNKLLNDMGKNITYENSLDATKRLRDVGLEVGVASFVLGTPSETKKSLENLVKFVEKLSYIGNVKTTQANLIIPIPGSIYWNQYSKYKKEELKDAIDLKQETSEFQKVAGFLPDGVADRASIEDINQAKIEIDKIINKSMEWIQ